MRNVTSVLAGVGECFTTPRLEGADYFTDFYSNYIVFIDLLYNSV